MRKKRQSCMLATEHSYFQLKYIEHSNTSRRECLCIFAVAFATALVLAEKPVYFPSNQPEMLNTYMNAS